MKGVYLSIVIPVYNEEESLHTLSARLMPVLEKTGKSFEVIYTNDGSKDTSIKILKELQQKYPKQVRIIDFGGNYGQHMAIMAAFEEVRGQVIINLDADLQNPPEEIPKLLEKFEEGHDVVGSYRLKRSGLASLGIALCKQGALRSNRHAYERSGMHVSRLCTSHR